MAYSVNHCSLTTSRLDRLRNLDEAITKREGQKQKHLLYCELYPEDREKIIHIIKTYGANLHTLEDRIQTEIFYIKRKIERSIPLEKRGKNLLPKVPPILIFKKITPFLLKEELTAFQTAACVDYSSNYSSLIASRFHRLNAFSQTIRPMQVQDIQRYRSLMDLHIDDRTKIIETTAKFNWKELGSKERDTILTKEIEAIQFVLCCVHLHPKSRKNYINKIPTSLVQTSVDSFLLPKEMTKLRMTSRLFSQMQISIPLSTSNAYPSLVHLIKKYCHQDCATCDETQKVKALDKLLSTTKWLSITERLEFPSNKSIIDFFELVEARNLLRMVFYIDESCKNIDVIPQISNLKYLAGHIGGKSRKQSLDTIFCEDSTTLEKATKVRRWFEQSQVGLQSFDDLYLDGIGLTLAPIEILNFQILKDVHLENNYLSDVPEEFTKQGLPVIL
jgi:hypothetical protein